jgi:hypothetical protein
VGRMAGEFWWHKKSYRPPQNVLKWEKM